MWNITNLSRGYGKTHQVKKQIEQYKKTGQKYVIIRKDNK